MKLSWIIAGVSAGLLYYVFKNPPSAAYATNAGDAEDAAGQIGNWGTKQRVKGTGGQLGGKLKEGFGSLTGDRETEGKGLLDQAVGTVKDTAGKAAHAVEDTVKGNK